VYAVQRVSWSLKNVKTFLNGIISGSERTSALPNKEVPALAKVRAHKLSGPLPRPYHLSRPCGGWHLSWPQIELLC